MSSDFERLRRLVNEELDKLDEYRPNTFMLSRMEEQDQDGDGDEDFDDVRVARYTKGGMSRDRALAKVRRKPMGKKGPKREDVSLSESMQRMTARERIALHEAVKLRILAEETAQNEKKIEDTAKNQHPTTANIKLDSVDNSKYFVFEEDNGWRWGFIKKQDDSSIIYLLVDPRPKKIANPDGFPYWKSDGNTGHTAGYPGVTFEKLAAALSSKSPEIKSIIEKTYSEINAAGEETKASDVQSPQNPAASSVSSSGAGATPAPEPEYNLGASVTTQDGKEIYRKTKEGWKTTLRVSAEQILSLVKPENRQAVAKQLKDTASGSETRLQDVVMINDKLATTFQRVGDLFADPTVVGDDKKIDEIVKNSSGMLKGPTGDRVEAAPTASAQAGTWVYAVGDATITVTKTEDEKNVKIEVPHDPSGKFPGFMSIFGDDSDIGNRIQRALGKSKDSKTLKIPLRFATEKSLMRRFSGSIFRLFGAYGKVSFEKKGDKWVCQESGKIRVNNVLADLKSMADDNQAKMISEPPGASAGSSTSSRASRSEIIPDFPGVNVSGEDVGSL